MSLTAGQHCKCRACCRGSCYITRHCRCKRREEVSMNGRWQLLSDHQPASRGHGGWSASVAWQARSVVHAGAVIRHANNSASISSVPKQVRVCWNATQGEVSTRSVRTAFHHHRHSMQSRLPCMHVQKTFKDKRRARLSVMVSYR